MVLFIARYIARDDSIVILFPLKKRKNIYIYRVNTSREYFLRIAYVPRKFVRDCSLWYSCTFLFFSPSLFVDNSLTKFSQREISLEKLLRRSPRRFVPRFSGNFYYETSLNGSRIRTSSIYTFHLFLFFFHREIRLIEEEIVFMLVNFHAILRKFVESCSRKKNNKRTWKDITYELRTIDVEKH